MMHRSPTSTLPIAWNDPFRLVLATSLLVLVAWIVVQSGASGGAQTRLRAGDVDAGDTTSIVVSHDDSSPFDLPFDLPGSDPADVTAPESAGSSRTETARSRGASTTRGSGGTSRQPSTDAGTTTPPPNTGGGSGTTTTPPPAGTSPAPQAPIVDPGTTATPGQPGTPGDVEVPGVEIPAPSLPGADVSSGQGTGSDVLVGEPLLRTRALTTSTVEPLVAVVGDVLAPPSS